MSKTISNNQDIYAKLLNSALKGNDLPNRLCLSILDPKKTNILSLIQTAYVLRKKYWGNIITIHILNNAQNGHCSEDCHYCAQSKSSQTKIDVYPMKSDKEILKEAQMAYKGGAFRYCMVFSGLGQSKDRIQRLTKLIKKIKDRYPLEVCVSPGVINEEMAQTLKAAGLDRLNHNINTSEGHYPNICTTHSYTDRMNTLKAAQKARLKICSGVIIGMGEKHADIIQMTKTLKSIRANSIPVNFFIPIKGLALNKRPKLSPEFCLRVLCLFRFMNPKTELRIAAGREIYLRHMEIMSYYVANSLFIDGYLNIKGSTRVQTLQKIQDGGFSIKSEFSLEKLLSKEEQSQLNQSNVEIKDFKTLHPFK